MRRLTNLVVQNVAAVEKPANKRKWLVVKAQTKSENERRRIVEAAVRDKWGSERDYTKGFLVDIFDGDAIVEMEGVPHAVEFAIGPDGVTFGEPRRVTHAWVEKSRAARMEKMDTMTFDDAMVGRKMHKVYAVLGDHYGALMETLNSIREGDESNKGAAMKDALNAFLAAMKAAVPRVVAGLDDELEKAGAKISADRLARLKTARETLDSIIKEAEMGETNKSEEQKNAPDATALGKLGNAIAAMFGKAAGADDATIAELEKAAGSGDEPLPEGVQAALAKSAAEASELKKANDALRERLDKAEADAKANAEVVAKMHEAQELATLRAEVMKYADIGMDPEKDAELLKAMSGALTPEQMTRVREVLASASSVAKSGAERLFKETGTSGAGANTAVAEVEKRVSEAMSKSDKTDYAAAAAQVFNEDPALYKRYRAETSVKV